MRDASLATTRSIVLVDRTSGERRFVLANRRPFERAAPDFDDVRLRANHVVLCDGHMARPARALLERARSAGAATIGDFADTRPSTRRLLPFVDHAIVPEEFVGAVQGDLNSRRGNIDGFESRGTVQVISAEVPLASMFGYVNSLRSMTQGRGTYTMQFERYAQVPESVAQGIVFH